MPFLPTLGVPELLVLLVIVILVFGVGKLPEVGGALGKSIREFKQGVADEGDKKQAQQAAQTPQEKPKA